MIKKIHKYCAQTYSACTVAADTSLCSHTFPSIDNKNLMLNSNLIFGVDGIFQFQDAVKNEINAKQFKVVHTYWAQFSYKDL